MKAPTVGQRRHWDAIVAHGCIVGSLSCRGRPTVHHCGTGGGGRKNHDKVICLCFEHHLGKEGIDGKRMSKRQWQDKYGTEDWLMYLTKQLLGETPCR